MTTFQDADHEAELEHGTEVTNVWWSGSELAVCSVCKTVIVSAGKGWPQDGWQHVPQVYGTSWDPEVTTP